MIGEIFEALFKAALPLGILSYFLFHWSLTSGRLGNITGRLALKNELKRMKREAKVARKAGQKHASANPLHNKWLKFGGGFYGVVALWTFVVIELQEIYDFLTGFAGLEGIFDRLGLDLVIGFFVNSLINFIKAIAWPGYWGEALGDSNVLLWLLVGYAGYWAGMRVARRKNAGEGEIVEPKNGEEGQG